jgi:hypothetical protein
MSGLLSVVLLEIDSGGIRAVPFECDSPWSIDGESVAFGFAFQDVQSPARQVQVGRLSGSMKSLQAPAHAFNQIGRKTVIEAFPLRPV